MFDFDTYMDILCAHHTMKFGFSSYDSVLQYEFIFAIVYMQMNDIQHSQRSRYENWISMEHKKMTFEGDPHLPLLKARYIDLDKTKPAHPKWLRPVIKAGVFALGMLLTYFFYYSINKHKLYIMAIPEAMLISLYFLTLFVNLVDLCIPTMRDLTRKHFERVLFTYHMCPWYKSRRQWIVGLQCQLSDVVMSDEDRVVYDNLRAAIKKLKWGKTSLIALARMEQLYLKYMA